MTVAKHTPASSHPLKSSVSKKLTSPRVTPRSLTKRTINAVKKIMPRRKKSATESEAQPTSLSAPSSPQRPSSPVPMEVQSEQPSTISPAPSDASIASSTSSIPSQPEIPQTYTPAEQKMVQMIASVSEKIDTIARELPTITGQISNHAARLALFRWPKSARLSFDAEKLNRSHKNLHYSAGMVDENVLQQIFRLDGIQTDNDSIRKLRKAAVAKGNETIKQAVTLRERMERLKRFLPAWTPVVEESKEAVPMEDTEESKQEEEAMKKDEDETMESEDEEQEKAVPAPAPVEPKRQSPSPPRSPAAATSSRTASPTPAPATTAPVLTALQKKYAHLNLPTYTGPQFSASVHPYTGNLVIEADMEGIASDDITVTPEKERRQIIVRGVRLPERRRSVGYGGFFGMPMHRPQPQFGYFTKVIDLDTVDEKRILDLDQLSATVTPRGVLQISLPRVTKIQPTRQQPQPRRAPVQHRTGVSYSSDEEDEADAYSHPYAPYHPYSSARQPAIGYGQRRPAAHPFFGGGFW